MENKKYHNNFEGVDIFSAIDEKQKAEMIHLATDLAHSIFTPHSHLKQFFQFASELDNILYAPGDNLSLIKAQYFSNVYFEELKTKGFELRNNPQANPLKIVIDYKQRKISNAFISLTPASEEKIFSTIKQHYQKNHTKELVEIKINYLKNLQKAMWAGSFGTHQAFSSLIEKKYVDEKMALDQVKILVEKERIEKNLIQSRDHQVKHSKKI